MNLHIDQGFESHECGVFCAYEKGSGSSSGGFQSGLKATCSRLFGEVMAKVQFAKRQRHSWSSSPFKGSLRHRPRRAEGRNSCNSEMGSISELHA